MKVSQKKVSKLWTEYTLRNDTGIQVSFLNYGGIITEIIAPDEHCQFENIVLAYKNYQDYEENPNYLGAIIGRVAGRIERAKFSLDGKLYSLEKNEGAHHLHGGSSGLHQVIWQVEPFESPNRVGAKLSYLSPHGDGGYPGNVAITVTYTLTNDHTFTIDYDATTDRPTILSLTNHTYFNLSGNIKKPVKDHLFRIQADRFVETNRELIATGNLLPVANTPFDLKKGKHLETEMTTNDPESQLVNQGYDHYFLLNHEQKPQAIITDPESGRVLTLETNQPGVVLYTGNHLGESLVLKEGLSERYLGFCLETQEHAASLMYEDFPNIIINENNPYKRKTTFSFGHIKQTHKESLLVASNY